MDKYYAICELDKEGNINHVYVDTITTDYEAVVFAYNNLEFNCIFNNNITLHEASYRHKNKYGYYKYGIKEIDMNKINLNKFPNYEQT